MATIRTSIQLYDGVSRIMHNMHTAVGTLISAFEGLQNTTDQGINVEKLQLARKQVDAVGKEFDQVENNIRQASAAQQQFNNVLRNGKTAASGLGDMIKKIGGIYAIIKGLKFLTKATDAYANNNARLNLINDGLQTQAQLQDQIYQAAQRSRGYYNDMVSTVAKLNLLAGNAFKSNAESVRFVELMNKEFKISGATAEESSSAMYQLTQALASGRLAGDEFRSVIENAPMLAQQIASYMGISMAELKKMSAQGQISADIIKNALFTSADDINAKFETLPWTFISIWTEIKNSATRKFKKIAQRLTDIINSAAGSSVVKGIISIINVLINVLGVVVELVVRIANFFVNNWSWIAPILWGIDNTLSNLFNSDPMEDIKNTLGDISGLVGDTAANTSATADAVSSSEEDLQYLRDIAEQEVINRFTTAEISVNLGGITNNVSSNIDLDGVVSYLEDQIYQTMQIAAEGA